MGRQSIDRLINCRMGSSLAENTRPTRHIHSALSLVVESHRLLEDDSLRGRARLRRRGEYPGRRKGILQGTTVMIKNTYLYGRGQDVLFVNDVSVRSLFLETAKKTGRIGVRMVFFSFPTGGCGSYKRMQEVDVNGWERTAWDTDRYRRGVRVPHVPFYTAVADRAVFLKRACRHG
jgi:hypothetical protein